jgi:hypothetical protein
VHRNSATGVDFLSRVINDILLETGAAAIGWSGLANFGKFEAIGFVSSDTQRTFPAPFLDSQSISHDTATGPGTFAVAFPIHTAR